MDAYYGIALAVAALVLVVTMVCMRWSRQRYLELSAGSDVIEVPLFGTVEFLYRQRLFSLDTRKAVCDRSSKFIQTQPSLGQLVRAEEIPDSSSELPAFTGESFRPKKHLVLVILHGAPGGYDQCSVAFDMIVPKALRHLGACPLASEKPSASESQPSSEGPAPTCAENNTQGSSSDIPGSDLSSRDASNMVVVSMFAVSRPGYLRTPLRKPVLPSEQADLVAALVKNLNDQNFFGDPNSCEIQFAVVSYSCGGPVGIHLAARYSELFSSLVLMCAVTTDYEMSLDVQKSFWGRLCLRIPWPRPLTDILSLSISSLMAAFPRWSVGIVAQIESNYTPEEVKKHVEYVWEHPDLVKIIFDISNTALPLGDRLNGWKNDMITYAHLEKDYEAHNVGRLTVPCFVVHGKRDKDVLIRHAEHFLEHRSSGNDHLFLEHGHHVLFVDKECDLVRSRIWDFFLRSHSLTEYFADDNVSREPASTHCPPPNNGDFGDDDSSVRLELEPVEIYSEDSIPVEAVNIRVQEKLDAMNSSVSVVEPPPAHFEVVCH